MTHTITFTPSFVIFWGISLGAALFMGGLLSFALVAMMMLTLISHEHAHLRECLNLHIPVNEVKFTWLGGMVDADIRYAKDAVSVLSAGLIDTGCYTVSFTGLLVALYVVPPMNVNIAMNPFISMIIGIVTFLIIMTITNILPINYYHKKHGIISTDGWAALRFIELRDELWNDGKVLAQSF